MSMAVSALIGRLGDQTPNGDRINDKISGTETAARKCDL
jgi:hypothetical protein